MPKGPRRTHRNTEVRQVTDRSSKRIVLMKSVSKDGVFSGQRKIEDSIENVKEDNFILPYQESEEQQPRPLGELILNIDTLGRSNTVDQLNN